MLFKPVSNNIYSIPYINVSTLIIFGDPEKLFNSPLGQTVPDIAAYHVNYSALIRDLLANPQIRAVVLIGVDDRTKNIVDNIWNRKYIRDGDFYILKDFPDVKISGKISLEHLQLLTTFVNIYHEEYHSNLALLPYNKEPIIYND